MKFICILAVITMLACVHAQTPCFARITASAREQASWTDGFTQYQVYDIVATNQGSCALTRVLGFFSAGQGVITESWNYDRSSGLITGYGDVLRVGQTFTGAGFVLANSSAPTLAFDRPACDESCAAPPATTAAPPANGECATIQCPESKICVVGVAGAACQPRLCADVQCVEGQVCINNGGYARCITTGQGSTAAPSSTTAAPAGTTAAPSGTTAAPARCDIVATVVRDESSWLDAEGRNTSVYRLSVTNQGPCALAIYVTSFGYYPGTLVSSWNLSPSLGGFLVTGYGETLASGATYSGAGLILANAPAAVGAFTYGTTCKC